MRSKKQSVCPVDTKIAISRDLGTWATRNYNKSIELGEKLASVGFKSRDRIQEGHKYCLFVPNRSHAYVRRAYRKYCAYLNKAILRMLDQADLWTIGNAPWHAWYVLYKL
jgi:hypothetical protein